MRRTGLLVLAILPLAACTSDRSSSPAAPGSHTSRVASRDAGRDLPGLHNVHRIGTKMISGAVPEGDDGFDSLKSLGVRTVVSVDGAIPDVERAKARGIRYVHIPITYAAVTDEERLAIARAVRDLPGPIYIHCHHGKHRGPAAAAAAAVALGEATPDQGVAFMKTAGTADSYTGLYACVAGATVAAATEIDGAPGDFPSVKKPRGIVAAMVEADLAFEHLREIRAAGWRTPETNPDLVPAAEAGRLADQLRFSHEDPASTAKGPEYEEMLYEAIAAAASLENSLASGDATRETLDARLSAVQNSCKSCHASFRDRR